MDLGKNMNLYFLRPTLNDLISKKLQILTVDSFIFLDNKIGTLSSGHRPKLHEKG